MDPSSSQSQGALRGEWQVLLREGGVREHKQQLILK